MSDNTLRQHAIQAMEFDPLALAEDITGEALDDSPDTVAIGFLLSQANSQRKRMFLSELGDTHWGISWIDFLVILNKLGFEIITYRRFCDNKWDKEQSVWPKFIIAAHREKYLLLCATSYISGQKEVINGGKVYGTLRRSQGKTTREEWQALNRCSHGPTNTRTFSFDYDVREGLVSKLQELEEAFSFVRWHDPDRFLWLMDYVQTQKEADEWERHRNEFLASAPQWVRDFILPDWTHRRLITLSRIHRNLLSKFYRARWKVSWFMEEHLPIFR